MKITIDISSIVYGTGVSVYTKNLVENLLKVDEENEYVLFGGSLRRSGEIRDWLDTFKDETFKASFENRVFPIPPIVADVVWNRLHVLPIEKLIGKIDVFHSSDWTQPPSRAYKVTTIHDLVPLKYPKLSHPKIVAVHKRRFRWIKKVVDRVIVPSETTKSDLLKLGISKEKITVISEAPDPIFKPARLKEINVLKRRFRIGNRYILAVGITPRKNLERTIEAFEKVKSEGMKLAVVGEPKTKTYEKRGVVYLGHVLKEEMAILYSGAEVLVYPSLYEGFGLPILEAFVCKTCVVTSNFGAMAEVAGSAAVLVDPYDTGSIVEGVKKAMRNKKDFIKKGLIRVKDFSWKKTAKMTLEIYNSFKTKK
jgi:glycosyltransferase involved in cell wall biosynthesis